MFTNFIEFGIDPIIFLPTNSSLESWVFPSVSFICRWSRNWITERWCFRYLVLSLYNLTMKVFADSLLESWLMIREICIEMKYHTRFVFYCCFRLKYLERHGTEVAMEEPFLLYKASLQVSFQHSHLSALIWLWRFLDWIKCFNMHPNVHVICLKKS